MFRVLLIETKIIKKITLFKKTKSLFLALSIYIITFGERRDLLNVSFKVLPRRLTDTDKKILFHYTTWNIIKSCKTLYVTWKDFFLNKIVFIKNFSTFKTIQHPVSLGSRSSHISANLRTIFCKYPLRKDPYRHLCFMKRKHPSPAYLS